MEGDGDCLRCLLKGASRGDLLARDTSLASFARPPKVSNRMHHHDLASFKHKERTHLSVVKRPHEREKRRARCKSPTVVEIVGLWWPKWTDGRSAGCEMEKPVRWLILWRRAKLSGLTRKKNNSNVSSRKGNQGLVALMSGGGMMAGRKRRGRPRVRRGRIRVEARDESESERFC